MGYAFINLKDHKDIAQFYNAFNLKKWDLFKSRKVTSLIFRSVKSNTPGFKAKMT
jgi:hypothetical protein